jgi:hypothetical protein
VRLICAACGVRLCGLRTLKSQACGGAVCGRIYIYATLPHAAHRTVKLRTIEPGCVDSRTRSRSVPVREVNLSCGDESRALRSLRCATKISHACDATRWMRIRRRHRAREQGGGEVAGSHNELSSAGFPLSALSLNETPFAGLHFFRALAAV